MTINNTDVTLTNWSEVKGKIKAKWSKFADADVESLKGNMHLITEKIEKAYGLSKDRAEQEYKDFKISLGALPPNVEPAKPN
jgi:uncharacterized protein YjbJ (UPF0337 family)